jgi:restriction system protein
MAIWLVRAGKSGEDELFALENGVAIIGWREIPSLAKISSYEEMKQFIATAFPDDSPKRVMNNSAQLWAFINRIQIGDIIVLPLKTRSTIAIGKITGPYKFLNKRHTRSVGWINEGISRSKFGQDLLYSFGAFMTVCQIKRNDAEMRIQAIMKGKVDPYFGGRKGEKAKPSEEPIPGEGEGVVDLEEQAIDQIRTLIEAKFKGHNLARLVESILNAQGYYTYRSPEGADGGVDILAGHGPMGLEPPKLCVQVKSGGEQGDQAVRELEGVMGRVGAQQGLFVSWEGFKKSAIDKTKELFFKVRLWDDKQLMIEFLDNYEKMSDQIKAELPLKRMWGAVPEED